MSKSILAVILIVLIGATVGASFYFFPTGTFTLIPGERQEFGTTCNSVTDCISFLKGEFSGIPDSFIQQSNIECVENVCYGTFPNLESEVVS